MFFTISKLLWMVSAPATALLLAVALGLALRVAGRRTAGRWLAGAGVAGLLAGGVLPVGTLLLRPLEDRFPQLSPGVEAPTGIVVLGGSTDQAIEEGRHRVTIGDAAERLTEAMVLARRYPQARLVFSGGTALLAGSTYNEADDARRLWTAMGLPASRITMEDRSRNTDENVRFTKALVAPRPGETWLLVTSAFHMPRAVSLFRANDWAVIPCPVDYRTLGAVGDLWPTLDVVRNLGRLNLAIREWVGLAAYRISGRTRSLLPEP